MTKIKLNNEEINCKITNVTDSTVEITVKNPTKDLFEEIAYFRLSQNDVLFEVPTGAKQHVRVVDIQSQAEDSIITLIFTLVVLK